MSRRSLHRERLSWPVFRGRMISAGVTPPKVVIAKTYQIY
jgi:hypothetical protein